MSPLKVCYDQKEGDDLPPVTRVTATVLLHLPCEEIYIADLSTAKHGDPAHYQLSAYTMLECSDRIHPLATTRCLKSGNRRSLQRDHRSAMQDVEKEPALPSCNGVNPPECRRANAGGPALVD